MSLQDLSRITSSLDWRNNYKSTLGMPWGRVTIPSSLVVFVLWGPYEEGPR